MLNDEVDDLLRPKKEESKKKENRNFKGEQAQTEKIATLALTVTIAGIVIF